MDIFTSLAGFGGSFLSYLIPFLFILTVVVFVHEMGHFLVARWCGVGIKAFSIGFGPEIFGFNDKHGTRWRVAWIPLGGYVKFIDDENAASAGQKSLESVPEADREKTFQGKTLGQRAAIVAAGPIANFIFAILIFTAVFSIFGERITAPKVDAVARTVPRSGPVSSRATSSRASTAAKSRTLPICSGSWPPALTGNCISLSNGTAKPSI